RDGSLFGGGNRRRRRWISHHPASFPMVDFPTLARIPCQQTLTPLKGPATLANGTGLPPAASRENLPPAPPRPTPQPPPDPSAPAGLTTLPPPGRSGRCGGRPQIRRATCRERGRRSGS